MSKPTEYSGIDFKPVPVRSSLRTELFISLTLVALSSATFGIILTFLAHRAVLEPLISPDNIKIVGQLMVFILLMVIVTSAGVSAIVAWILAHHFTLPIRKLEEGMQRVFQNDLDVNIAIKRKDELGNLVQFFNNMVHKLREVHIRNEAISQLKSQFISVAAHQLRTPLTGLKWSLDWLLQERGGKLTDRQKQTIEKQFTATTHMIHMVNELLDVALAEEGKFGYALQSVEIVPLVEEILESFAPAAESREIKISLEKKIRPNLAVIGDPVQLKLALSNIIDNAVRYTKSSGQITIILHQKKDWLDIKIMDTGIGIPKSEQGKLFTKFFRATNAQRLQPDGSGLGLFMVHNVIVGHGGTITVDSTQGQGTNFTITLPLRAELVPPETLSEGIAAL